VTGLSASGKVYNGNRNATLTGAASISPIGTDDVTLVGTATGRFADKNAGTAKAVTVTGQTISGADAGNYILVEPTTLKASITQKSLAVTGLSASGKVYNANTKAKLTGTAAVNPITGDDVTLGGTAVGRFADKNVGTGKAVTVTGQTLSGADAGNYKLVEPTTLKANITPAKLTYTATPKSVAQGSPITGLTGMLAGLLGSDTIQNSTTGTLRWTTNATSSSPVGSYRINGSGLSATNYTFRQAPGNATALTIH